ncbi:glycoside hydrolase family 3 N-terminal domain-containing protein [Corticibacterium sp. UT-5YL-CI-8]|nr:glycoside hydrolase family 3 N-terminal domain-containing protein [Tianweitania sp. UT-5YL-CI-8]
MQDDFSQAPFHLDSDQLAWVEDRMGALTQRQKIAQVFNVLVWGSNEDSIAMVEELQPGSIGRFDVVDAESEQTFLNRLNAKFTVPVVVTTDLEGSFATPKQATPSPNPMAFAAINDPSTTEAVSAAMARQAAPMGIKWSFTPAVDINKAWRSGIVGTRSYGSDQAKIREQALAHMRGLQSENCAATAKHWPGEGYDDRDQHLVTTVNPLSVAQWEETYGVLYRALIDGGVLSIMPAHIAFPAYMREVEGVTGRDAYRPASINRALNENLLRGKLGFNGLLVSDATPMAGLTSWMKRDELVVELLNTGCDVILFAKDLRTDIETLEAALADGRVSQERLDQAVRRQLALKARIGLHKDVGRLPSIASNENDVALIADALKRAPTLVKDSKHQLPMTPDRYRKVLLVSKGVVFPPAPRPLPLAMIDMMRGEGFEVTHHQWGTPVDPTGFDLVLYVFAEETLLTRGIVSLNWLEMNGQFEAAMNRPWHDVPTIMVSFGWPYYLAEATLVPTYVNAYAAHPAMQRNVLDALMGRAKFPGVSPVDPWVGMDPAIG